MVELTDKHLIFGVAMTELPAGYQQLLVGMGCFWGAERRFWQQPNVYSTAVGYAGGHKVNPLYQEVCSGQTGHTEVVKIVYLDEAGVLEQLLSVFWESHDPTQGMRQGNDIGSQYRSAVFGFNGDQMALIQASKQAYQERLSMQGFGSITTEIAQGQTFYFAEDYHQQYLYKNPQGYCGLRGTGVSCS